MPSTQQSLNLNGSRAMGRSDYAGNHIDSFRGQPGLSSTPEAIAMFGVWLKAQREVFGISQRELSKLSGVAQTAISELEGGTAPNLQNAPDIIEALRKVATKLGHAAVAFLGQERIA